MVVVVVWSCGSHSSSSSSSVLVDREETGVDTLYVRVATVPYSRHCLLFVIPKYTDISLTRVYVLAQFPLLS